jgi:moderate conductance mechanosensitive channel
MGPGLFSGPVDWHSLLLAVVPTLVVAAAAALLARRGGERVLKAALGDHLAVTSPLVRGPLRLIAFATFILMTWLLLFPAFELAGLTPRAGVPLTAITQWIFAQGPRILLIIVLAFALTRTLALLARRFEYQVGQGTTLDALERAKRARTLGSVVQRVGTIAITMIAVLMILGRLGVDITPVLTGAGIAGLAVGFGAQTLVRDIISGFFIILEDQIRVGDVASINGVGGLVEELNLRTIVLRDEEGAVHIFPNGAINTLANRSKDFSYYVITMSIPYSENPDRIVTILRAVGEELRRDERLGPFILEPLEILGIDGFGDWSMQMKLRIKTVPLKQWDVGRELRRRIRMSFAQAGVHVPFPALGATAQEPRDGAVPPGR